MDTTSINDNITSEPCVSAKNEALSYTGDTNVHKYIENVFNIYPFNADATNVWCCGIHASILGLEQNNVRALFFEPYKSTPPWIGKSCCFTN